MNNIAPTTIKRIIAALVVLAFLLIGWLIYQTLTFHVTTTNPRTSSVSDVSPFLKVNFSKSLAKSVLVSSTPSVIRSQSVSGKTLTLNLIPLTVGQDYTVTIGSISSQSGDTLHNIVLHFTARDISFDSLPEDQQKAILANQDSLPKVVDDPVFKYVPHTTLDYSLKALVRNGVKGNPSGLYLQADIYLSQADMAGNVSDTITKYEQEVVDYIKSTGLNPDKYHFEYNVVSPSALGE